jgi:hypothetical protein
MKLSNHKFSIANRKNKTKEYKIKINNIIKNDYEYNNVKTLDNFNKINYKSNNLKPTHKGCGKIIQPGGGFKGN